MRCKDYYIYVDDDTLKLLRSIKRERKKLSLNQRQLADFVGIDKSLISRYERGKTIPKLSVFLKLAKVFQWDISHNVNFKFRFYKRRLKSIHKLKHSYAFTIEELRTLMFLSHSPIIEFLTGKGSIYVFAQFKRIIQDEKKRITRR